ncbi:hypothetical protein SDC9_111209 [bioreactor metagenome]|uniref:Uncharacterized protein n=1 Tax=bioreactor metagenome TaxID=1076179 RepID=A0A645BM22_9ZZZZ|nr:hypothetical protein [Candidatus Metalachnospira sp.]
MQDKKMQKAIDNFILQRINDHSFDDNKTLQEAYACFKDCYQKLKSTLSDEGTKAFTECSNTYTVVDGETIQCYYRAGFFDAILFLNGWGDREWK